MGTNEFKGNLSWISPNKIIKEGEDNKLGSFFIGLGAIFNDLKDYVLFEQLIVDIYRKPEEKDCSDHVGNYGGVMVHINKLVASTIHEFFKFLKENADIISTNEFNEILERLPKEEKELWKGIVLASCDKLPKVSDFLNILVRIRSNIAFHYDHSGKILRRGFISRFFSEYKDKRNEKAYYSIGESIELSRFYFSDAAVEESLYIEAGKTEKKKISDDISIEEYKKNIMATIQIINRIIMLLLKNFLQLRRNS